MDFSSELIQKAKKASSAEELREAAKAEGIELSENEAASYFNFLHGNQEFSDEELSMITGGKEGSWCNTTPGPFCTGVFLYGADACRHYVETADPNGMPTAFTLPVLCTCKIGYFTNFPMNRPYQA